MTGESIPSVDERIARVRFDAHGLVPAVAQQWDTREVLMLAWMNADALRETLTSGRAVYWSRSRRELWRKGDTSGHVQIVKDVRLDCDGDVLLVSVDQIGPACHTETRTCFDTDLDRADVGDRGLHPVVG
ncbi:phosphoribosyl-AMP cyclohydrolase [Microbacterium gilvum]|uniref:Phosphoribosyl-AMP cyclohydrolase n=1 Tax=Microbacterium gilvum TaxID=1336204 RepID=A0ABP8ZUD5_9MICO